MRVDPPAPAAPVVPGYVLEELLGRGGSGQVWRARPRGGGDPVAVKVLLRGDPARQVREAALLAELDHPHLVRVHRVVRREVRGGPAEVSLVLDLLAGGSLATVLARRGRLRPGEVVTAIAPVAAAVAHAHERGVVHGDLSPGNVVFTAEGRPVLTDLGTARLVGEEGGAEVTPAYVDPVVARGGAPGPASDVFGVAAAAFHALTGIPPWNAAEPGGALAVAAGGALPDLALLAPDAPAELVEVVQRGLSAEPHLRGSAAAFALDLRHSCRPEPVRLPGPGRGDEVHDGTGRGPRTELTHQAAGRRAHAAPVAGSRLAGVRAFVERIRASRSPAGAGSAGMLLRRRAVSAGALLVLAGALAGAAWAGASWGRADPGRAEAAPADAVPAGTAPGPPASPSSPTGPPGAGGDAAAGPPAAAGSDGTPPPADRDGWAALVGRLYEQRARAYATADGAVLAGAYVPGSPLLARDAEHVARLAGSGRRIDGFAPAVLEVTAVRVTGDRAVLELVDEVPAHRVVAIGPHGPAAQDVPGRGAAGVIMTLDRTAVGWRISAAARSAEPAGWGVSPTTAPTAAPR